MNQQQLQIFTLCLRSIYASITLNCPLILNKVGSEKIPLPQAHMLFRCAVYRDSYFDTNPKMAIYHDTVYRGDTHPYLKQLKYPLEKYLCYFCSNFALNVAVFSLTLRSNITFFCIPKEKKHQNWTFYKYMYNLHSIIYIIIIT